MFRGKYHDCWWSFVLIVNYPTWVFFSIFGSGQLISTISFFFMLFFFVSLLFRVHTVSKEAAVEKNMILSKGFVSDQTEAMWKRTKPTR